MKIFKKFLSIFLLALPSFSLNLNFKVSEFKKVEKNLDAKERSFFSGSKKWAYFYGPLNELYGSKLIETSDGYYILAGNVLNINTNLDEIIALKIDFFGNIIWQKIYSSGYYKYVASIQEASDGGYLIAGTIKYSYSGNGDIFILKLDNLGNILWQKSYGTNFNDSLSFLKKTSDDGYILAGNSYSPQNIGQCFFLLKLDINGNILWQKCYGNGNEINVDLIEEDLDGGFIVSGGTDFSKAFILKIDLIGNILWQKNYYLGSNIYNTFAARTLDGIAIAYTTGLENFGVLKTDFNGNILWGKVFYHYLDSYTNISSIIGTSDNGFAVLMYSYYDKFFSILKVSDAGDILWNRVYGFDVSHLTSNSIIQTSDNGFLVSSSAYSYIQASYKFLVAKIDLYGSLANPCNFSSEIQFNFYDKNFTQSDGNFVQGEIVFYENSTIFYPLDQNLSSEILCSSYCTYSIFPNYQLIPSTGGTYSLFIDSRDDCPWTLEKSSSWINFNSGDYGYGKTLVLYEISPNSEDNPRSGYIYLKDVDGVIRDLIVIEQNGSLNGESLKWLKIYEGDDSLLLSYVKKTSDGGYIITGDYEEPNSFFNSIFVMKIDEFGNILWQKKYNFSGFSDVKFITETSDKKFILAGSLDMDILILFLDSYGNLIWKKILGGSGNDHAIFIQEEPGNNFVVAGYTNSFGSGLNDIFLMKINKYGNILWQKTYGTASEDYAKTLRRLQDGTYLLLGSTNAFSPSYQPLILKIDKNGNPLWQKVYNISCYPGDLFEQTQDGKYIFGCSYSIPSEHETKPAIIKIDGFGNVQWQYFYDNDKRFVFFETLRKTKDDGFIFSAESNFIFISRLDSQGNVLWSREYAIPEKSYPILAEEAMDGGYNIFGNITSSFYIYNFLFLKVDNLGGISEDCNYVSESEFVKMPISISYSNVSLNVSNTSFLNYNKTMNVENSYIISKDYCVSYCNYFLSPNYQLLSKNGGVYSFTIYKKNECPWQIENNLDWVNILSEIQNFDEIKIEYMVQPNTEERTRYGYIYLKDGSGIIRDILSIIQEGEGISCLEDLGDVNMNGALTSYDCSYILQYITNTIDLTDEQICRADINENSFITSMDASYCLQCIVEYCFGIPQDFLNSCQNFGYCRF